MSDIAPKPIAAPSGVMPALPTATPATTNTATAAEIPAAVANLSVGTVITGTVIERNPRGLVVLRTDKGTIKLQTPVPLKTGSTVTLQIQTVGAQVQLSILSIDGQPAANAAAKPPAVPIRSDIASKPIVTDAVLTRPQTSPANNGTSPAVIGDDGQETAAVRPATINHPTPDRGISPRAAMPQATAPATSFIARPLTQIGSAGLEALSTPSTSALPATAPLSTPSASTPPSVAPGAASTIVRAPAANAAAIVTSPTAPAAGQAAVQAIANQTAFAPPAAIGAAITQATVPPPPVLTAGQASVPANITIPLASPIETSPATINRPSGPAMVPPMPTSASTPAIIAPGTQFTAALVAPPAGLAAAEVDQPAGPATPNSLQTTPPSPLPATAMMPAPLAAPTSLTTPQTLPADQVILRLLGIGAPQNPQAPTTTTPMTTTVAQPAVAAGLTVPSSALTTVGTIVDSVDLPHMSPQLSTASANDTANVRTLIATPFGLLAAAGPPPGPVGTRLLLEVILSGAPDRPALLPLPGAPNPPMAAPLTAAEKSWPALREIMTTVQMIAPDAAEHLANVTLPRVGPNLAAGMMAFIAAARQGNPRSWLGEQTVDSLMRTGHGHLIDRLADDFTLNARVAADTGPHGWQTLLLPLYDGDRLQQIRCYWQRQKRKSDQRKDATRFVVEAELTKLGVLQLDGIFDKPQFDLVVRTSTSLPAPIRGDIIEIFGDALLATNLKGAVSFQTNAGMRVGALVGNEEAGPDTGIGLIV